MNNKPHQRLLDGMPPHIAEKVDKMIGNMKEVYDLAMESWEGCDGCTEGDKYFFINGYMKGYNRAMRDDQPRLMNGDGSEIRKVKSKHVELHDEINLEEIPKDQLEGERNPVYKYFDENNYPLIEGTLNLCEEIKNKGMIGKIEKINDQWMVAMTLYNGIWSSYIPLHEDSLLEIKELSEIFDNLEARILSQPEVVYDLVYHKELGKCARLHIQEAETKEQKTAMTDLLQWVRKNLPMDLDFAQMIETKIESLLLKEKESIMNAYYAGGLFSSDKGAERYYNETYGK